MSASPIGRSLGFIALLVALAMPICGTAQAQNIPDLVQRARNAILAAPPAPADGSKEQPATSIGIVGDKPFAAAVTVGGNVFSVSACVTFFSGSTPYTGLLTTDNTFITSSTTLFATTLQHACTVRGSVAINVTSISGSTFIYDAVAY